MKKKTIAIITDKPKSIYKIPYLISHLIPCWSERAFNVVIGTKWTLPKADIALLHVDATKVSRIYQIMCKKYPIVLNGNFLDNSKQKVSRNLLSMGEDYHGPVIIKTNGNYGGFLDIPKKKRDHSHIILKETTDIKSVKWKSIQAISPGKYPVLEHQADIPNDVWKNKRLVVEKFIPEYDMNGLYCLRACFFFGEKEINMMVTSTEPVIKGNNICSRQLVNSPAPEQLRNIREKLKIDFGRFDYVMSEGKVVLYDVNKTATMSQQASIEWADQVIRPLSLGIDEYL
ncbi:MAG: hypothetical protein AB7D06_10270 [Pedobacter sp.]